MSKKIDEMFKPFLLKRGLLVRVLFCVSGKSSSITFSHGAQGMAFSSLVAFQCRVLHILSPSRGQSRRLQAHTSSEIHRWHSTVWMPQSRESTSCFEACEGGESAICTSWSARDFCDRRRLHQKTRTFLFCPAVSTNFDFEMKGVGGPTGGRPRGFEGWSTRRVGGPIRVFFSSTRHNFHSSFSLLGSFRGIVLVFEAPRNSKT